MSVWAGVDNGAPTADFSPQEFVPTDPYQLQWPMWGNYVGTKGKAGEKIDDPGRQKLVELYKQWLASEDDGDQAGSSGTRSSTSMPTRSSRSAS